VSLVLLELARTPKCCHLPKNLSEVGDNLLNWTVPNTLLNDPNIDRVYRLEQAREMAANSSRRVVSIAEYRDLYPQIRDEHFVTPQHPRGTFRRLFASLFQPSPALQAAIIEAINNKYAHPQLPPHYLAVQIRMKYPLRRSGKELGPIRPDIHHHPKLVTSVANHAVQVLVDKWKESSSSSLSSDDEKSNLPIYVTSDSSDVVHYLLERHNHSSSTTEYSNFLPHRLFSIDLKRSHPWVERNTTTDDLLPSFVDLWILGHAECVSYGIGGYGVFGARLAGEQCMVQHRSSKFWRDYKQY
jgi:hypothetical protein